MEISGWLKKRSSGKFKSWNRSFFSPSLFYCLIPSYYCFYFPPSSLTSISLFSLLFRRYFVLNQSGILKYYDHKVTSQINDKSKRIYTLTNFFTNVGAFERNIPHFSDINWAFMFVTSDSIKPMLLVIAESIEEKNKWITFLNDLFLKEKLTDLYFLKESMYYNSFSSSNSLNSSLKILSSQLKNQSFNIQRFSFPLNCYHLISLFIGDIYEVTTLNFVCKNWNHVWKVSQPFLTNWLIRYGHVQPCYRWGFWCSLLQIQQGIDKEEFHSLIESATEFNKYEIIKDVNRAFGTSTGKRMIERRFYLFFDLVIIIIVVVFLSH